MNEQYRSMFALLMGIEGDQSLELLIAEEQLSQHSLPEALLSPDLRDLRRRYSTWLDALPKRDANELSFSILLSEDIPLLQKH